MHRKNASLALVLQWSYQEHALTTLLQKIEIRHICSSTAASTRVFSRPFTSIDTFRVWPIEWHHCRSRENRLAFITWYTLMVFEDEVLSGNVLSWREVMSNLRIWLFSRQFYTFHATWIFLLGYACHFTSPSLSHLTLTSVCTLSLCSEKASTTVVGGHDVDSI